MKKTPDDHVLGRSRTVCLVLLSSCLALSGTSRAAQPPQEVRIGVILPLSGPVSPTGNEMRHGIDFAVEQINQEGIRSLGGARLRVIYADSRGLPEVGMSEAERLILRDKAAVLLGAFQSGVTLTSTEVAERYHLPYLVLVSVASSITGRGFHWVFRATETTDMDARLQVEYLNWVAQRTGVRPHTVAFVAENSEWGESSIDSTKRLLPQDWEIVLDERYAPGSSDFTTLAQRLRQIHPDVIFLAAYVSDGILLTRALAENHVSAMAILTRGAEHGDPSFAEAVGDLGDYQTWMVPFHTALSRRQPWMVSILTDYRRRFGTEMSPFAATAYANVHILKDALERAGSTQPGAIRDALAATHLSEGRAMVLPFRLIEFDSTGQNPHATLPFLQTVAGNDYIVFPRHLADPEFRPVFPMPGWLDHPVESSAMATAFETVLNGLLNGGLYALFAVGLSLVFGVMRLINFAHGSFLMLGMFLVYGLWRWAGIHPYVLVLVVCPALFLAGYGVQRMLLNPLLEREGEQTEPLSPLLATLGLALVLDNGALLLFGPDYRAVQLGQVWSAPLGPAMTLDLRKFVILLAAAVVVLLLVFWLARTRTGLALRAVAQDRQAAMLHGIDPRHAQALAFGVGAATVGLASCLLATYHYIHPTVGANFLIKGYLVVVLGGMSSLGGTLWAALAVGVVEAVVARTFSTTLADASVFGLFVAFLLIRPRGLISWMGVR